MIPLIITCKDQNKIEEFTVKFIEDNNFDKSLLFEIEPIKAEITIDQIRSLKKELIVTAAKKRLIVFKLFDNSSAETQNSLLKILEEQSESNQFIFHVNNLSKVLPTIHSRSKIIQLKRTEKTQIRSSTVALFELIEKSKTAIFLSDPNVTGIIREDAELFLEEAIFYYEKLLVQYKMVAADIIKKTMNIKQLLINNNLNPQLAVDNVLIYIYKKFNT